VVAAVAEAVFPPEAGYAAADDPRVAASADAVAAVLFVVEAERGGYSAAEVAPADSQEAPQEPVDHCERVDSLQDDCSEADYSAAADWAVPEDCLPVDCWVEPPVADFPAAPDDSVAPVDCSRAQAAAGDSMELPEADSPDGSPADLQADSRQVHYRDDLPAG
jgi:hypothetical protein